MNGKSDGGRQIAGGGDCVRCGEQPAPGDVPRPAPLCAPCALRTAREFATNFLVCLDCGMAARVQVVGPDREIVFTDVASLVVRLADGEYRDECSHVICICEGDDFCTCGEDGGDADAGEGDPPVAPLVM